MRGRLLEQNKKNVVTHQIATKTLNLNSFSENFLLKISFDQQIDPSDDIEPIDVPLAERNACVREKRAAAPPPPPP